MGAIYRSPLGKKVHRMAMDKAMKRNEAWNANVGKKGEYVEVKRMRSTANKRRSLIPMQDVKKSTLGGN